MVLYPTLQFIIIEGRINYVGYIGGILRVRDGESNEGGE
jgi:hypothetical protein